MFASFASYKLSGIFFFLKSLNNRSAHFDITDFVSFSSNCTRSMESSKLKHHFARYFHLSHYVMLIAQTVEFPSAYRNELSYSHYHSFMDHCEKLSGQISYVILTQTIHAHITICVHVLRALTCILFLFFLDFFFGCFFLHAKATTSLLVHLHYRYVFCSSFTSCFLFLMLS